MVMGHQPRPLADRHQGNPCGDHRRAPEPHQRAKGGALRQTESRRTGDRRRLKRSRYAIALDHHPVVGPKRYRRPSETIGLGVFKNSWFGRPPIGLGSVTNPFWRIRRGLVGIELSVQRTAHESPPELIQVAPPHEVAGPISVSHASVPIVQRPLTPTMSITPRQPTIAVDPIANSRRWILFLTHIHQRADLRVRQCYKACHETRSGAPPTNGRNRAPTISPSLD